MKIVDNYKVIFSDNEGNYCPTKHYIHLLKNGNKIGNLSKEFKTNFKRELFLYKDIYWEVRLEDLSENETIIYDVLKVN